MSHPVARSHDSTMNTISSPAAPLEGAAAPPVASTDLNVFLAYENLAAALRAAESLAVLSRNDPDGLVVKLSPWSFATLAESQWRSQAAAHVARAHLLVIAACSAAPRLSVTIEAWLRSCLAQPREERLGVAALFHHSGGSDDANSPRLRCVQRIAQEAGCAFFAPGVRDDLANLV